MQIDMPDVVAEVKQAFEQYERALVGNDIAALNAIFRADERSIRYGGGENLYGYKAIQAFRAARSPVGLARTLSKTVITTYGRDFAVMYADLDNFKAINDGFGHAIGDRVLQSVAERLRSVVRESDTVARFGGDEFVILQPIVEIETDAADFGLSPHRLTLKLELFQHTGTFKARGAVNTMLGLGPEALRRGVTAVSAGNHAIATAYAAKTLGASAKVVMMASANPARVASISASLRS